MISSLKQKSQAMFFYRAVKILQLAQEVVDDETRRREIRDGPDVQDHPISQKLFFQPC